MKTMKTIEDFAKFLSNAPDLMSKCIDADFDVKVLWDLAAKNGFELSAESLTPLAQTASAWMKKTRGEKLTDDEHKLVELVEAKAKELKLSDTDLASVAGGMKEGYDKPSSVGQSGSDGIVPAAIAMALAGPAVLAVAVAVVRSK